MKLIWSIILLLIPVFVFSQQKKLKQNSVPDSAFLRTTPGSSIQLGSGHTFSHKTSKGSVYISPTDKMSCLVLDPKLSAKMPNGAERPILPYMPNAIPKKNK